jgi:hypothetical protein
MMNTTPSPEKKLTCGFSPITANRPKSSSRNHVSPGEINRLARVVWLKEGARPGLERQYVEEVSVQLRATRHLLEQECLAMAAAGNEIQ